MKNKTKILIFTMLFLVTAILSTLFVSATQSAVNLGTASDFVILAKSGISTTGTTAITGNIGVSPIDSTAITGFGLIMDSSNTFSISSLITGKIYSADYTSPTNTKLITAVSDMETAYTDAAGRTETSIITELGAGDISGMTLTPGLYKWGTGVLINNGVTLNCQGNANSIFIFQIAQDLTLGNGAIITLSNGCQAKNIFWQVGGQATLGTTSVFNGNILSQTLIEINTGAVLNGRALAQTAVTLDANTISLPVAIIVLTADTSTNSNSGKVHVDTNSPTDLQVADNNNGIGQDLSQQIAEKKTEYKSGNFTTSLGQFLNVREIASGFRELREGNVLVKTNLTLTKIEGNKSRLEVKLGNGTSIGLKIMPSTASETALARLKLKVCNATNNCTIELKEVGVGNKTQLVYQMKAQKNVKILGLFRAKMNIETNVNAETKEIISTKIPWWSSISIDVSV